MKVSDAFPSKYLKGKDLKNPDGTPRSPVTVTISKIDYETFQNGEGSYIMYFQGKTKGLILKKTKALLIEDSYGDEMNTWVGKTLVLSCGSVMFQGTRYDTVEITVPQGPSQQAPAPQTYTPPTQQAPDPMSFEDQQNEGCNDDFSDVDQDDMPEGW